MPLGFGRSHLGRVFVSPTLTLLSLINARHVFFNKCRCSGFRNSLHLHFIICRCSNLLFSLDLNLSWSTTPACVVAGPPLRPVFGWERAPGAESYTVQIVRLPASTTLVILIAVSFVTPRTDVGLPHTSDRAERRENQSSRKRYGWAKCKCFP